MSFLGSYSVQLCRTLDAEAGSARLELPFRRRRYEPGDILNLDCTAVWPEGRFGAAFRVQKFVGGGFAGQVYRCVLESVRGDASRVPALREGGVYAVKIQLPASRFSRRFRDMLYAIGFQSPFSPQLNEQSCRAGLLMQKLVGMAAGRAFGRDGAVAEVYASFFDSELRAFGEVREWVEGRAWRLEPDTRPRLRRRWRTVRPEDTGSPEYVAKRQFMMRLVQLLHQMGAWELARQYEWWTMKSQPNVLKRTRAGSGPADGLCAVDFRAGLTLLPFLPMSPADFVLIAQGARRGSLVQFDRFDAVRLRTFFNARRGEMPEAPAMVDRLLELDAAYRRRMPDFAHQGLRLFTDRALRADVRAGLAEAWRLEGLADDASARRLAEGPCRCALFWALGLLPVAGRLIRLAWMSSPARRHVFRLITGRAYFRVFARAGISSCLARWHRAGRTGEERTKQLLTRPGAFWAQRLTVGLLPPVLHRAIAEPGYVWGRVRDGWRFMLRFCRDEAARVEWLAGIVRAGREDGSLDPNEHDLIMSRIRDPFIVKYLKSVAVHFATLPVTQLVSGAVGTAIALRILLSAGPGERSWDNALAAFTAVVVAFQLVPISPGSICRGLYVVYLMLKDRDWRDYVLAAPLSFVKYIGYLAFPLQMATAFPVLSRFIASRWARSAVNIMPVFGEKGALLEHFVFDWFYNRPRIFGAWARPRMPYILDAWMIFGLAVLTACGAGGMDIASKTGMNVGLAVLVVNVLPRTVFYPVVAGSGRGGSRAGAA
ncbi:MAG: hypothetical protein FJ224_03195 [Lentisphaerae bacterium]|nr:hypothetical protein [Lentisphaerota bacterium]